MNAKGKIATVAMIIYWLLVAAIPLFVWFGKLAYDVSMESYIPKPGHVVVNDFEIYWRALLFCTAVILWPLSLINMIVVIKSCAKKAV